MKISLTQFLFSGILFLAATPVLADCPTEMPFNQLVDCIALGEDEPDITDLMASESENKEKQSIRQVKIDSKNTVSIVSK